MKTIGSFVRKIKPSIFSDSQDTVDIVYDESDNTFAITIGDPMDCAGDHIWLSCDDIANLLMQLNKLSIVNQAEDKSNDNTI